MLICSKSTIYFWTRMMRMSLCDTTHQVIFAKLSSPLKCYKMPTSIYLISLPSLNAPKERGPAPNIVMKYLCLEVEIRKGKSSLKFCYKVTKVRRFIYLPKSNAGTSSPKKYVPYPKYQNKV